jgi:hypothetical protein
MPVDHAGGVAAAPKVPTTPSATPAPMATASDNEAIVEALLRLVTGDKLASRVSVTAASPYHADTIKRYLQDAQRSEDLSRKAKRGQGIYVVEFLRLIPSRLGYLRAAILVRTGSASALHVLCSLPAYRDSALTMLLMMVNCRPTHSQAWQIRACNQRSGPHGARASL